MVNLSITPYVLDAEKITPDSSREDGIPGRLVFDDMTFVPVARWENWQVGLKNWFERDVFGRDDARFDSDIFDPFLADEKSVLAHAVRVRKANLKLNIKRRVVRVAACHLLYK